MRSNSFAVLYKLTGGIYIFSFIFHLYNDLINITLFIHLHYINNHHNHRPDEKSASLDFDFERILIFINVEISLYTMT